MVFLQRIFIPTLHKLTWLALAEDHAALSRSLEQLMAFPRSVKVKRVLMVSLAAEFVAEADSVRAAANETKRGACERHACLSSAGMAPYNVEALPQSYDGVTIPTFHLSPC